MGFFYALLVLVIVLFLMSIKIVHQSEVAIVERLGKFYKIADSGLNIIIPILDKIVKVVDLKTQVLDSQPQPVITKDNVTMSIDTVLYYQITDPFKSTYEIANLVTAIRLLTTTTLRDIIGTMELDYTLSSRDDINNRLRVSMDEATDKWGVRVERVEVKNIDLPADIKDAMEKQMRAEREKRAVILQAEGERQAAITQAEGKKQAQILEAEANKQAKILAAEAAKESEIITAQGQAIAIETVANAEACKNEKIYESLHKADLNEKILALKSVEAMIEMAKGENKVFVPFETSNILGNVGAIGELLGKQK